MGYWDYYRGLHRDYCKDPFPHSLLRTRQSWRCSGGFRAYWLCRVCRAYRVNKLVGFKVHLGLVGFILWFVGFIGLIGFRVEGLWFRVE